MEIGKNVHAFIWNSAAANNCNTYLIDGPTRILIDPGHARLFEHVRAGLSQLGLNLEDIELIICTHSHQDHMEAIKLFKETNTLIAFHENEWQFVKEMERYHRATVSDSIVPDFFLKAGSLSVDNLEFVVYHTPGHSPGSICLHFPTEKVLFTGDLVFKGGIGRTDLPGGSGALLKESITNVSELDIEWVLPGHGDVISGKDEVTANFKHIKQFWFNYL